jgi:DedD protein
VPIEIPRRDALPPLVMPPPRSTATRPPAPVSEPAATTGATPPAAATTRTPPSAARGSDGAITESSGDTAHDSTDSRATVHASSPAETPRRAAGAAVVATAPASAATRSADGERARALLEGRPASSAEEQRFVVQVGAFADAEAARETRKNVEKLGLKTYTQVAQTSAGNRIRVRVGPFTTRGEAEAALAKAKAAGMNAVLLTL